MKRLKTRTPKTMHLFVGGCLAAAMLLAGCGDSDSSGNDAASQTEPTAAPATTTTTGTEATGGGGDASTGPDTSEAPTSTQAPPSTEAPQDTTNPNVVAAQAVAGSYSGEWNNTTFGSSGSIEMSIEVNEAAGFALVTLDLGGNVFGASDPDPTVFEIDLVTGEWLGGADSVFGDTELSVDDNGGFVLSSGSVAGVGGLEMSMTGTAVDGGYSGDYEIVGLAEGTFTLTMN